MSREFYGANSAWSPGMDASFVDHLLMSPKTSWRGVRGVRAEFGSVGRGELFEDEDFEDFEDFDADWDDEDIDEEEDEFGRLYKSGTYMHMESASPGDIGVLTGRSGKSGMRGGRPNFGAVRGRASVTRDSVELDGPVGLVLGIVFLGLVAKGMDVI